MPPALFQNGCAAVALFVASTGVRAQQATPPPPIETPETSPAAAPFDRLQWRIGETTIELGGYVKIDLIHDFDEIGSTDSFDPRTIPTDGSEGTNTRVHARQTRLNLDVRTPSSVGPMRVFVEGDFFGSGNSFRMRHAYGTLGPVLGGQTWTTFMDEDAMPETLDFESPIALPMVRQAQLRYRQDLGDGDYVAFALEDPDSDLIPPDGVEGEIDEPAPDVNARLRLENGRGHVQLGTFLGLARFQPAAGSADDVTLWGLNLSTKLRTFGPDDAYVQLTYGDGVGRYRGGLTAAPDANGDLEAITVFGYLVGYEHHWSDAYRSTLSYSRVEGDIPDGAPAETNEQIDYLALNLIWQFADRAWTGIEYLYGSRETIDDADGEANRIQISMRFNL